MSRTGYYPCPAFFAVPRTIRDSGGNGDVGKDLVPLGEGLIGSEDGGGLLIASGNQLEKQISACVAGFYGPLKERGIEPIIELPEGPVIQPLDRAALSRVFGNILSNALKYSAGDLKIVMRESGEVSFSNTAPGLDDVQVGRLFDRFFTVEAVRGSAGLGLSIAKTLVERMGGTILAEYQSKVLMIRVNF